MHTIRLTDTDRLAGILNLISAVAERLTGERPCVQFEDAEGHTIRIRPDTYKVTWEKVSEGTATRFDSEVAPTPLEVPDEAHAISR